MCIRFRAAPRLFALPHTARRLREVYARCLFSRVFLPRRGVVDRHHSGLISRRTGFDSRRRHMKDVLLALVPIAAGLGLAYAIDRWLRPLPAP